MDRRMFLLICLPLLAGCPASLPPNPQPSPAGYPIETPWQCQEILRKGGKC